ncbi:MAG: hypothetical protein WCS30_13775 [Selenomonadaceae bacterium]
MKYIVTGCDGKLGGRVAENMLEHISPEELIFTCLFLNRLNPEKKKRWERLGVNVSQANYDNVEELVNAFEGGDRLYIVSAVTIGEIRIQ